MTASSDDDYAVSPLQLLGARTTFAASQTARCQPERDVTTWSKLGPMIVLGGLFSPE
jgi:hypothetical protein